MSLLKIDSFRTGCILLSGLFLYDVWWVFGTTVVRQYLSFFGTAKTDGRNVDGQRRDQPRPPHEDTLAKVN